MPWNVSPSPIPTRIPGRDGPGSRVENAQEAATAPFDAAPPDHGQAGSPSAPADGRGDANESNPNGPPSRGPSQADATTR